VLYVSWHELAQEARKAANGLVQQERYRSSISRAYYAVYSLVTHCLCQAPNVSFPQDREGPNHPGVTNQGGIRRLIDTSLPGRSVGDRKYISGLVGQLYTMRIYADYKPSVLVEARDARIALAIMAKVFDRL
jgi:hypothetical protein